MFIVKGRIYENLIISKSWRLRGKEILMEAPDGTWRGAGVCPEERQLTEKENHARPQ